MAEAATDQDSSKALEQVFTFLRAKDDTSRFVGFSLLRSILDANEALRNDETTIKQCWEAVPNKFLTRLLKTGGTNADEIKNMNDLAAAVIHTFANLLPAEQVSDKKMFELVEPLANVVPRLEAAPQMLAFHALQCVVSSAAGAHVFARAGCHKDMGEGIGEGGGRYSREYFKLYDVAWSTAHDQGLKAFLSKSVIGVLESISDSGLLLEILGAMSSQLNIIGEPRILEIIIELIQTTTVKRPTARVRNAATKLASEVIQRSSPDSHTISKLFEGPDAGVGDKPFAYVFVQYVLIDVRSTIPSLMTNLASPTYETDSLRLAACYDVVAGFITYLISIMDEDVTEASQPSPIPPDLLLKLRRDLSETFSLTLEFFRDRWDAVISGASGLDPSARIDPKSPAMLTWDNPAIPPVEDPIILSSLRALSLWLREDDNPELNTQTMGIADMLAALYESSMKDEAKADFRPPILVLLRGLLASSDEAVQLLLDNKGWEILAKDLEQAASGRAYGSVRDIVRVLLAIVDSDVVPQSREAWMDVVRLAGDMKTSTDGVEALESIAEMYQLADAILGKAPRRLQRAFEGEAGNIARNAFEFANQLRSRNIDEGLIDSFSEVAMSLGS